MVRMLFFVIVSVGNGWFCLVKCYQNVEFDDFLLGECIYHGFVMDNTTTILSGLVGAGTLSAGVESRALRCIS